MRTGGDPEMARARRRETRLTLPTRSGSSVDGTSLSQEARNKAKVAGKGRMRSERGSLSQEARDKAKVADKERMRKRRRLLE